MLHKLAIQPIQQFSYTSGKNATDSALIIDAMDVLHTGSVDGFCLVSSDSDFTRLASRLRESRMFVIGMGESKTPTAFKSACDTFKYLDVLMGMKKEPLPVAVPEKPQKQPAQPQACSFSPFGCGAESVPRKKRGLPDVAAFSSAWRCVSRFNTGRQ